MARWLVISNRLNLRSPNMPPLPHSYSPPLVTNSGFLSPWSASMPRISGYRTFNAGENDHSAPAPYTATKTKSKSKPRRTNRACLRCRKAKVRCTRHAGQFGPDRSASTAGRLPETPCERCARKGEVCEYPDGSGDGDDSEGRIGQDAHAALMDSASRIRASTSTSHSDGQYYLPVLSLPWDRTRGSPVSDVSRSYFHDPDITKICLPTIPALNYSPTPPSYYAPIPLPPRPFVLPPNWQDLETRED
ncbi:hypothetical protein C8F01DRAFT_1115090 [Mycena amicta]|nr:hypothetical protein C8F01DRAFT_1115090 [Mycena amicta]